MHTCDIPTQPEVGVAVGYYINGFIYLSKTHFLLYITSNKTRLIVILKVRARNAECDLETQFDILETQIIYSKFYIVDR